MSISLREQLTAIIDPVSTPVLVRITYNDTRTDLRKVVREDGTVFWVGTPVSLADGRHCRYALTVQPTGYIEGSAAVNFITSKGWRPGAKKSSAEEKSRSASGFRVAFIQACLMQNGQDVTAELAQHLQEQTGMKVTPGEMDDLDVETLALMGVPYDTVQVARSNHVRFDLDIPTYLSRFIQPSYALCEQGAWTPESDEVALTSTLTQGQVYLLRANGWCLRRQAQQRRKGGRNQ